MYFGRLTKDVYCVSPFILMYESVSVGHTHAHATETAMSSIAIFTILWHSLISESGSGPDPVLSSMVLYMQINEKGHQIGSTQ